MPEVMHFDEPSAAGEISELKDAGCADLPLTRIAWAVLDHTLNRRHVTLTTGAAGTSKTFTAERFTAQHPGVIYVYAGIDAAAPQSLMAKIARAILKRHRHPVTRGFPRAWVPELMELEHEVGKSRQNNGFLAHQVRECVDALVDMLIFDEVSPVQNNALESVRALHDETGIGVSLLGNLTFPTRFSGTQAQARFEQFTSRIDRREDLSTPMAEDYEALFDFHRVRGRRARDLIRRHAERDGNLRRAAFIVDQARCETPDGPLDLPQIAAAIDELGLFE